MTSTPGRPVEPTIHQARTRPEATDFALKNRVTNDWFRHDSTTMKVAPIAANYSRPKSTGEWLAMADDKVPVTHKRYPSKQAEAAHDRIQGNQEAWFKHDDNRHYVDPTRADRGSSAAIEVKSKMHEASKQTMDWYKHENKPADHRSSNENGKLRLVGSVAQEIGNKLQTKAGAPEWFEHKLVESEDDYSSQPKTRLKMREALENYERDRAGCVAEWNNFDDEEMEFRQQESQAPVVFRVASRQGQEIAAKLSSESGNWFEHDASVKNTTQGTKKQSDFARMLSAKHRGSDMQQILQGSNGKNEDVKLDLGSGQQRLMPAAQEFAVRSQQGTMSRVLNHEYGQEYQSQGGGCPRVVKPEALATFTKNKGSMDECLQGYLAPPSSYEVHKARPADGSLLVKHSGARMEKALKGEMPESARADYSRAVKAEGADYAERNRGTVGQVMTDFGRPPTSFDISGGKGLRTEAAQEIARKYQRGSVANLLC